MRTLTLNHAFILFVLTLVAVAATPAARADDQDVAMGCALYSLEKDSQSSHRFELHEPGVMKRHPVLTLLLTRVLAPSFAFPAMIGGLAFHVTAPARAVIQRHWDRHKSQGLPPPCRMPAESISAAVIEDGQVAAKTVLNELGTMAVNGFRVTFGMQPTL